MRLQGRVETAVEHYLAAQLENYDYEKKLNWLASLKLDNKITNYQINPAAVEAKIKTVSETLVDNLVKQAKSQIITDIARKIDSIDFNQSVINAVAQQVEARLKEVIFPNNSISWQALKQDEIAISGDQVRGGIITRFGSTGIDDQSTACKVTILDDHTVVENNLVAASAAVKGALTVEGDLVLHGEIPIVAERLALRLPQPVAARRLAGVGIEIERPRRAAHVDVLPFAKRGNHFGDFVGFEGVFIALAQVPQPFGDAIPQGRPPTRAEPAHDRLLQEGGIVGERLLRRQHAAHPVSHGQRKHFIVGMAVRHEAPGRVGEARPVPQHADRKSTRLNSSHT